MSVPNTYTFGLQDVTTELYNDIAPGRNLSSCFSDAIGIFDANYVGNKDNLYNFRDYNNNFANISSGWITAYDVASSLYDITVNYTVSGYAYTIGICYGTTPHPTIANNRAIISSGTSPVSVHYQTGGTGGGPYYANTKFLSNGTYYFRAYITVHGATCYSNEFSQSVNMNGTVVDYDGNSYKTICIANMWIMAQNLATTHFADGTPLTFANDTATWETGLDCYCYPYANVSYVPISGLFYNADAALGYKYGDVNHPYTLVSGWHVPSMAECSALIGNLGGSSIAGGLLKMFTGETNDSNAWQAPNTGGSDFYGFRAAGYGMRNNNGAFGGLNTQTNFWTSEPGPVESLQLTYNSAAATIVGTTLGAGLAIRLFKN